ncbi:MAG TPA: hypothetical protein VGS57_08530 [Thermoanaerobaculia bacterium]|jgi:hypothetical protein|nr:hypothetical protein [Thermoanaerobaculia bacterium]
MSEDNLVRDVSRSLVGLGLTLPLFGVRQAVRIASASPADFRDAARSIDGVARTARNNLDGVWHDVAQLGSCFEEILRQFVPPTVRSILRDPRQVPETAVGIAQRSLDALQLVPEGLVSIGAAEVSSKLEVFCLVADAGAKIDAPPADTWPYPVNELVENAYQIDPYATLWAVEGLGQLYAVAALAQEPQPRGLLGPQVSSTLPAKSLLMLHAGIGLGFAQQRLTEATRRRTPGAAELEAVLADVVELCVTNSLPGYVGPAFESIGLVAISFFPDLVPQIDAALRAVGSQAVPYYWHGVGRGVYFLPINLVPGSGEQVFATAIRLAPDEEARLNSVAGAAWAVTLVAQRNPRIMCELYLGTIGETLARDGGFSNGVASSNIMRTDLTPGSGLVENFLDYQPPAQDGPEVARLWKEQVLRPSQVGVRDVYPVLRRKQRLGEIFRYHDDLRAIGATTAVSTPAVTALGASGP